MFFSIKDLLSFILIILYSVILKMRFLPTLFSEFKYRFNELTIFGQEGSETATVSLPILCCC